MKPLSTPRRGTSKPPDDPGIFYEKRRAAVRLFFCRESLEYKMQNLDFLRPDTNAKPDAGKIRGDKCQYYCRFLAF
jgi:hypothetical protein